jgi:hypothetical protein
VRPEGLGKLLILIIVINGSIHISHSSVETVAYYIYLKKKLHGMRRDRTIPTERPPLVGEVIAIFCG